MENNPNNQIQEEDQSDQNPHNAEPLEKDTEYKYNPSDFEQQNNERYD